MKKMFFFAMSLAFLLFNCSSPESVDNKSDTQVSKDSIIDTKSNEDSFNATLNAHFAAIQNRDIDGYLKTVSENNQMTLVFDSGDIIGSKDSIIDFHKGWFSSKTWVSKFTIIKTIVRNDFAIALLSTNYKDKDAKGNPFEANNILSLIFEKQNGEWRLIFDQNTSKK